MASYLLGISFIFAIIDWLCILKAKPKFGWVTKPATLVLLSTWVVVNLWNLKDDPFGRLVIWFMVGAVFSLIGDVFLMLSERRFPLGLFSFLLTHVAYTIGFLSPFPVFNTPRVVIVLIVAFTSWQIMRRIDVELVSQDQRFYRISAISYAIVITIMLISAMWTLTSWDNNWIWQHAWLVSMGGFLFYLSDTLLGWNRFVAALPNAQIMIRVTYHLGQMGILSGAILHFHFLAA